VIAPATRFYFAYGSNPGSLPTNAGATQQPNDESYVTVINPSTEPGSAASVTATFFAGTGDRLGSRTIAVAAQTRQTIVVNSVIPPLAGPYWTMVASDKPIFVEKPQYFGGSPNEGRHPGVTLSGSPDGLTSVLFPNVNTASATGVPISETVFLLNPGPASITVSGTYYAAGGQTATATYIIGAGMLKVVGVNADAAGLPPGPLGAQYVSTSAATSNGSLVAARIANTPDQVAYIGNQGAPGP
jgi:hypothetical protein